MQEVFVSIIDFKIFHLGLFNFILYIFSYFVLKERFDNHLIFPRFPIFCLLLISCPLVFGRELECRYGSTNRNALWPEFKFCEISSVDLSQEYETDKFSFTGTPSQKSAATVLSFVAPTTIDFLPKQILDNFPQLNGISITNSGDDTFTIIGDNFFSKDFAAIEYLSLHRNEIESIEANAFRYFPKLKWIKLGRNPLRSLPHPIFKNNPEMIAIWLDECNIISITPDFFKNLNKLQYVQIGFGNECSDKEFGCTSGSCSVAQEELDTGLATCYKNCLGDAECSSKL
jgi:hypothetical protein